MKKIISLVILGVFLSGCATVPQGQKSSLYHVESGGFNYRMGSAEARYSLTLVIKKKQSVPLYIDAEFQSPCSDTGVVTTVAILEPDQDKIGLSSTKIDCLESGRNYRVVVRTYDSAQKDNQIDELVQLMHFQLDPITLKALREKK